MTDEKNGKYWYSDSKGMVESIGDLRKVMDNNREVNFIDIGSKHSVFIYDEGLDVYSMALKDLKTNTQLRPYWVKEVDVGEDTEYTTGKLGTEIVWLKGISQKKNQREDTSSHEIMKPKKVSVVGGLLEEINSSFGTKKTSNNDSTTLNNSKTLNSSGVMGDKLSESKDQSKLDVSVSMENPGKGKRGVEKNFEEEYVAYTFEHAQGEYNSLIFTLKELS